MSGNRKSRLAGAMQQKGRIVEDIAVGTGEAGASEPASGTQGATGETSPGPSLSLAPPPAQARPSGEQPDDEPSGDPEEGPREQVAIEEQPPESTAPEPTEALAQDQPAQNVASAKEPSHASAASSRTQSRGATKKPPAQTARVRAGVGQIDLAPELVHIRQVMQNGRDQRRYVEDLPRRSDKGTYMRLPIHLQDALAEYCDRNSAPMADFIAAVLDAYFRDIGLLPPLGEGHRPSEAFLDRIRKESRTYDY